MSPSLQRYVLLGLGGAWCVVMLMRILMAGRRRKCPCSLSQESQCPRLVRP